LSESSHDDDKINFVFPITVIYRNFQQTVVNNNTQLDVIKAGYVENQDYHEIECIDFNYPFAVKYTTVTPKLLVLKRLKMILSYIILLMVSKILILLQ